jgi:O-antigen ligase
MATSGKPATMTRSEKIIWIFFAGTCIQLVFQHPSVSLVAGERANLFSGLLCFLTLMVAVAFSGRGALRLRLPECLISLGLAVVAGVSGAFSLTPLPSSFRVFVLLASGLGGFWCARILLQTPENQRRFTWLCLWLLGGLLAVSFVGFFQTRYIEYYICDRSHPLTNVILLLSFAPLTLLGQKSRSLKGLGIILLALSYLILCLSERISVVFIPLGVCLAAVLFGTLRWKSFVLVALIMALVVGAVHQKIIWHKLSPTYPAYRVEYFRFSWSIVKQHPLLGIGLRSPRDKFLEDYQPFFPSLTKQEFTRVASYIVSADNQFLTFLVGLGAPFTLIYLAALGMLLARLVGLALKPPPGRFFHPLALLFPLTVALVHFQFYDGLLFPQSCWFFHVLLGLIPPRERCPQTVELRCQENLPGTPKPSVG